MRSPSAPGARTKTSQTATDDRPGLRPAPSDAAVGAPTRTARLTPLLFGLGLATALPPATIVAPPGVAVPTIRADAPALVDAAALVIILDRSVAEVGRGRVALREVDERLVGLTASIQVFQVAEGPGAGALVSLGVVGAGGEARHGDRATTVHLWELACAALRQHAIPGGHLDGLGDDAFLAVYDGTTAQVARMRGDRLATASVTCLAGDENWAIATAHAIAALLDARLNPRA